MLALGWRDKSVSMMFTPSNTCLGKIANEAQVASAGENTSL